MQDFDTLRNRVEATAQKLASVQTERHDQTQSLVDILRQLEEKHAAQEQQLAYYRDRVVPLEQANQQLTGLIEHLLGLIDRGFGEDSLGPLRNASEMASAMLANDLLMEERRPAAAPDRDAQRVALPEFGSEDAADDDTEFAFASYDEETQGDDPEDDDAAVSGDSGDDDAVTDLQMEEDALISLDELLEIASGDGADEPDSFSPAAESAPPEEAAPFEDVSQTVLEHEAREEDAAGPDHLPDRVKQAMAAAAGTPEPAMAAFDAVMASASASEEDEVEALSAITEALEAGASGDNANAPPPAPSDIRALLLRVEALARKAEAMRMAQAGSDPSGKAKPATAKPDKSGPGQTAAA